MNDEHLWRNQRNSLPTPEHAASVLGVDEHFLLSYKLKITKLESTGQV